jgi:hypothetical protein
VLFYNDQAVTQHGSVQETDRLFGFIFCRHPDIPAPPEFTGSGFNYQVDGGYGTRHGEQFPHFILRDCTGNVSNIDLHTHI